MQRHCENCRKWEKDAYRKRFQVVHFLTVLPTDPHLQLRFPEKFVKNLKKKLQKNVTLKGPNGQAWNVGLMRNGDDLFLQNGWDEFANAHNLKEGEILFFRYNGESRFDVLVFDGSNLCENESSCNCNGEMNEIETTEREPSLEIIRPRAAVARSKKKPQRESLDLEILQLPPSRGDEIISASKRKLVGPSTALSIIPVESKVEEDSSEGETHEYGMGEYHCLSSRRPITEEDHYLSSRRPITEEEMSRARELAVGAGARSNMVHFIVVMKKSHVSTRFYMAVPAEKARSYFPREITKVILRVEGRSWAAKYYAYKSTAVIRGPGWADFVFENNLELGDACLFELCPPHKEDTILMNVGIFRVVEEVVPLQKVTAASIGKKQNYRRKKML